MNSEIIIGQSVGINTVSFYAGDRGYVNVFAPRQFADWETVRAWSCGLVKKYGRSDDLLYSIRERVRAYAVGSLRAVYTCRQNAKASPVAAPLPFIRRLHLYKLKPTSFKYDRAVGVELECVRPSSVAPVVLPYWARMVGDGSIQLAGVRGAGVEYNVLCLRRELEHRLYKVCSLLSGHVVNKSCGLHIHLDCRGKTSEEVWALTKKMNAWLFALRELVPESRRDNTYCKFGTSRTDRYRAVNFTAFAEHSTLEVRLHSGTVDYTKVISWIRLLELLLVINSKPKSGAPCLAVLAQLPLCEYERSYWLQRHRTLNPALYPSAVPSVEVE